MKAARARAPAAASLLAMAATLLASCGQRGDLYLPEPPKTAVPPVTPAGPAASVERQEGCDVAVGQPPGTVCREVPP